VNSARPGSCMYLWSSCEDGIVREIRCRRDDDGFLCFCIAGLRKPVIFRSPDLCGLDTGINSIDRAFFAEIARDRCDFRIATEPPGAAPAP
jgi:hypothetical protein